MIGDGKSIRKKLDPEIRIWAMFISDNETDFIYPSGTNIWMS